MPRVERKAKGNLHTPKASFMKGNLSKIFERDLELKFGQLEQSMKGFGSKIKDTVRQFCHTRMVLITKGSFCITSETAEERKFLMK